VGDIPRPLPRGPHDLHRSRPDGVFKFLAYGTSPLNGSRLVRKFSSHELQT